MKAIIFLFLSLLIISCFGKVKFPILPELDAQLLKVKHNEIAELASLSRQKEFHKYRKEIIEEYTRKLKELNESPIVMIEYISVKEFNGSNQSRLGNILITENHLFFYLISVDSYLNETHGKLTQHKLGRNELNEITKRIRKTSNMEGNCTTAKTNPMIYFFTIWDKDSYRILVTDLLLRRDFFNDHRGWDYFDKIEYAIELHYCIIETMQKNNGQIIKEFTRPHNNEKSITRGNSL